MEATTLSLCSIFLLALCWAPTYPYNVAVDRGKVTLIDRAEGSEFGFSLAFTYAPGWKERFLDEGFRFDHVLLVGSPNTTVNGILGHGAVLKCSNPDSESPDCVDMDLIDSAMCELLMRYVRGGPASRCEENQRLGTTIAVNENFARHVFTTSTLPMVTICAPAWKNVMNEWRENYYLVYPIGMCFQLFEDLNRNTCDITSRDCWPFWPNTDSTFTPGDGFPINPFAQAGMSSTFTKDGLSEVIGAPGTYLWKGSFKVIQKEWKSPVVDMTELPQTNTQYLGYAVAAGNFNLAGADIAAGVPNFYSRSQYGHFGRVLLYGRDGEEANSVNYGVQETCAGITSSDMSRIERKQVGTKFGASLAAIDVTGDSVDELFVGAPLYAAKNSPEEGRVFVYKSDGERMCGPVSILSGSEARYARFGTSIAAAGDLNGDSLTDVFIGAPYEDERTGAVYLYHGTTQGVRETAAQRIAGRELDSKLRAFGWSLAGNTDVDKNLYPDVAVGAYLSSQAVILRSRPIINIHSSVIISPRVIPLNASGLACSLRGQLCVTIDVEFRAEGKGLADKAQRIEYQLEADTLLVKKEGYSRVAFREEAGRALSVNVTLNGTEPFRRTYVLDVKGEGGEIYPREIWTALAVKGTFQLIPSAVSFSDLDPILNETSPSSFSDQVNFDKQCEQQTECISDIVLDVKLFLVYTGNRGVLYQPGGVIYLDDMQRIRMEVDVTNNLKASYNTNFTATSSVSLISVRERTVSVSSTCKQTTISPTPAVRLSHLECQANNKLDKGDNIGVLGTYDISQNQLMPGTFQEMREQVNLSVSAYQINADTNPADNYFNVSIPVKLKYDIVIYENKALYEQVLYKEDEASTRELHIVHQYTVINNGPSFFPGTRINISVPISKDSTTVAELGELSVSCWPLSSGSTGERVTTPQTTVSTIPTTRVTIPSPDLQRKRRDTKQNQPVISDDHKIYWKNSEFIVVVCNCSRLEKQQNQTFNISIKIKEKAIAQQKRRDLQYGTRATVTDPSIWYGGKVVPFEQLVYAQKWTSLIVEQGALPQEVNIWIIIGAIVGAVVLLVIIIIVLWKCGFFKRKQQGDIQRLKQDSLYKRRSQAVSSIAPRPASSQPYNPIDTEDEKDGKDE